MYCYTDQMKLNWKELYRCGVYKLVPILRWKIVVVFYLFTFISMSFMLCLYLCTKKTTTAENKEILVKCKGIFYLILYYIYSDSNKKKVVIQERNPSKTEMNIKSRDITYDSGCYYDFDWFLPYTFLFTKVYRNLSL